mmetsp:Transcript_33230/g.94939  ORF Transcript_33230/g.94939 Transcript_33230/m.94939 type:complete len:387 (+) Transcript_33230:8457-9617(+)
MVPTRHAVVLRVVILPCVQPPPLSIALHGLLGLQPALLRGHLEDVVLQQPRLVLDGLRDVLHHRVLLLVVQAVRILPVLPGPPRVRQRRERYVADRPVPRGQPRGPAVGALRRRVLPRPLHLRVQHLVVRAGPVLLARRPRPLLHQPVGPELLHGLAVRRGELLLLLPVQVCQLPLLQQLLLRGQYRAPLQAVAAVAARGHEGLPFVAEHRHAVAHVRHEEPGQQGYRLAQPGPHGDLHVVAPHVRPLVLQEARVPHQLGLLPLPGDGGAVHAPGRVADEADGVEQEARGAEEPHLQEAGAPPEEGDHLPREHEPRRATREADEREVEGEEQHEPGLQEVEPALAAPHEEAVVGVVEAAKADAAKDNEEERASHALHHVLQDECLV